MANKNGNANGNGTVNAAAADGSNLVLDWALYYLSLGYGPLPVWPGKKNPMLTEWKEYERRLPTQEEVTKWFTKWPNANIALVTGEVSGVDVLDLDNLEKFYRDFIEAGKMLPTGFIVSTPRGGRHWYFKHIPGLKCSNSKLADKVDVRAGGGIIMVPPSVVNGKRYEILYSDFAHARETEAPEWLKEMLLKINERKVASSFKDGKMSESTRNAGLARIAGSLRRHDLTEGVICRTLLGVNEYCCDPPLDEAEVGKIAGSIAKYPSKPEELLSGVWDRAKNQLLNEINGNYPKIHTGFARLDSAVRTLAGKLTVIAGEPKSYKSTLVEHIALHNAEKGVPVLLIDGENGPVLVLRRLISMKSNVEPYKIEESHLATWKETKPDCIYMPECMVSADELPDLVRYIKAEHESPTALIIVDSLQSMVFEKGRMFDRRREVDEIVRILTYLANKGIGVLVTSEIPKSDNGKSVVDAKESGGVRYKANTFISTKSKGSILTLNIQDNRSGPKDEMELIVTDSRKLMTNAVFATDKEAKRYEPNPTTNMLSNRLATFFAKDTDGEIMVADLAKEFDMSAKTIGKLVKKLGYGTKTLRVPIDGRTRRLKRVINKYATGLAQVAPS